MTRRTFHTWACNGCQGDVRRMREYSYMVQNTVWKRAIRRLQRLRPGRWSMGDMLCIQCLESGLGRELVRADFDWTVPLTYAIDDRFPRSQRLQQRLGLAQPT